MRDQSVHLLCREDPRWLPQTIADKAGLLRAVSLATSTFSLPIDKLQRALQRYC